MLTTTVLAPPVIAVGLVTKSSIAVCWSCGGEVGTGGGAEIEILDLFLDFFLPPPRPFPCDMVSWVCLGPVWCCWRLEGCLQRLNGMCNAESCKWNESCKSLQDRNRLLRFESNRRVGNERELVKCEEGKSNQQLFTTTK